MKTKKPKPRQIVWPPRMTPKRKRALALLQEWADKDVELEYSAGPGVTFTGTISELCLDDRRTSFLFKNTFGVHAVLPTDAYGRIEIAEIGDLPTRVGFFRDASGVAFQSRRRTSEQSRRRISSGHMSCFVSGNGATQCSWSTQATECVLPWRVAR